MSSPFDRLVADYVKKRGDLNHIDVDLSEGEPLRIFYSPVMNAQQKAAIWKHLTNGGADLEVFVTSLIMRALNEDGSRMFRDADRKELATKVDANVLEDIAIRMGSLREDVDPKE